MRSRVVWAAIGTSICCCFHGLLGPPAYASRARLLVMGDANPIGANSRGSLYYDDDENLFYNPAYVNDYRNWVRVEKTNGASGAAEGGFFASTGILSFGTYFNRGDAIVTGPGNTGPTNVYTDGADFKPIDLFAGMDFGASGAKAGAGLTFGGNRTNGVNSQDLSFRAGAVLGGFEPFAGVKAIGEGRSVGQDFKTKDASLGLRYRSGEIVPFGMFRRYWYSQSGADTSTHAFGAGVGRNTLLAEHVHLNVAASFWRDTRTDHNVVPVDFSLEAAPISWLALRGGLSFRPWDRLSNNSQPDATGGRFGASVMISKLSFDWAIGHIADGESTDGRAFDFANGFFTAASLTYNW